MADQSIIPEKFIQLYLERHYRLRSTAEQALTSLVAYVNFFPIEKFRASNKVLTLFGTFENLAGSLLNLDTLEDWYVMLNANVGIQREPQPSRNPEDSDDSDINEPADFPVAPNDIYSIEKVRRLYTHLAEEEMKEMKKREDELTLDDLLTIIRIRHIARERISKYIKLPVDGIKVTIDNREVKFEIRCTRFNQVRTITYQGSRGNYKVYFSNAVYYETHIKYQTLAAKDFFFLVQNERMMFRHLAMDMTWHRIRINKYQYPFISFHRKVQKYLQTLNHQLNVVFFSMRFFERPDDPRTFNQGLAMTILPFIRPDTLLILKFRVWKMFNEPDYYVNMNTVSQTEQWRACRILDLWCERIRIQDYSILTDFDIVRLLNLPQEDKDKLVLAYANFILPPGDPWNQFWYTDIWVRDTLRTEYNEIIRRVVPKDKQLALYAKKQLSRSFGVLSWRIRIGRKIKEASRPERRN
ncbi:hypothetical protein CAEBREN_12989 [Caenorhabditis brenneri]|uniref:Uncharacterized protein n=1 Tax=Caenorhabditis brenneri TaxID=135651 RepID=G0PAW9_CAEBE|nr:hypothetical protein CAEBREN_12989 [Caenorhabditis brenneri]